MVGTSKLLPKLAKLKDKRFRHSYIKEHIRTGIACQIRLLRTKAHLTQAQLAEIIGTKQAVISRLEDPDSGTANLNTLFKIAEALDVSLLVKFATFGKFIEEAADVSPAALTVCPYTEEYEAIAGELSTAIPAENHEGAFPAVFISISARPFYQEAPSLNPRSMYISWNEGISSEVTESEHPFAFFNPVSSVLQAISN